MSGHVDEEKREQNSAPNGSLREYSSMVLAFGPEDERPSNEYVLNVAFLSFFGFMLIQAVFAIIAKSESMLADSEAMSVDAMTYLFNMLAEHVKHRPYSEKEKRMPWALRHRKRKLTRLYMELMAPLVSVVTLIFVTIAVMREAFRTLTRQDGALTNANDNDDEPSVGIMLFFSGVNLLLDVVNVTCFARAHQAFGLSPLEPDDLTIRRKPKHDIEGASIEGTHERSSLVKGDTMSSSTLSGPSSSNVERSKVEATINSSYQKGNGNETCKDSESEEEEEKGRPFNLNMCSAWTHVCADTMRSIAVLVAAAIAYTFEGVYPSDADAVAALIVSFIILVSLLPLLRGLATTAVKANVSSEEGVSLADPLSTLGFISPLIPVVCLCYPTTKGDAGDEETLMKITRWNGGVATVQQTEEQMISLNRSLLRHHRRRLVFSARVVPCWVCVVLLIVLKVRCEPQDDVPRLEQILATSPSPACPIDCQCPDINLDLSYNGNSKPAGARLAYLITVHNRRTAEDAAYLFRAIRSPQNIILVHVDTKFDWDEYLSTTLHLEMEACPCGTRVHVASIHSAKWSSWSMNDPTFWGMETALSLFPGEWDVFLNLSGDTMPVYTAKVMAQLFDPNHGPLRGTNFVTSSSCETGLLPSNVYIFPSFWHKRNHYTTHPEGNPIISYIDDNGHEREIELEVHFGSQWMALQPNFVEYLITSLKRPESLASGFKTYLIETRRLMTDETFIPTLLMHVHPFNETLPEVTEEGRLKSLPSMRSIRFERMDEHVPTAFGFFPKQQRYDVPDSSDASKPRVWGPYFLGVYDLENIKQSGALFVRKVSIAVDPNIVHMLPVTDIGDLPSIQWPDEVNIIEKPDWDKLKEKLMRKAEHGAE